MYFAQLPVQYRRHYPISAESLHEDDEDDISAYYTRLELAERARRQAQQDLLRKQQEIEQLHRLRAVEAERKHRRQLAFEAEQRRALEEEQRRAIAQRVRRDQIYQDRLKQAWIERNLNLEQAFEQRLLDHIQARRQQAARAQPSQHNKERDLAARAQPSQQNKERDLEPNSASSASQSTFIPVRVVGSVANPIATRVSVPLTVNTAVPLTAPQTPVSSAVSVEDEEINSPDQWNLDADDVFKAARISTPVPTSSESNETKSSEQ